jgi:hypothetical protein
MFPTKSRCPRWADLRYRFPFGLRDLEHFRNACEELNMRELSSIQRAQVLVAVLLVLLAAATVFQKNEYKPSVLRAK